MEWYQIVSLIITALSLPTLAGLIWKDLYDKKQEKSEKNKQKKK